MEVDLLVDNHIYYTYIYAYIYIYIYKIYTNLPRNVTVRLPHPWRGNSQCQETFLAPSADKETRNNNTELNICIYIIYI